MAKPQPIWQDLPIHFKESVVEYLDFESRLNLQTCSKSDYAFVNNCPYHLYNLFIEQELEDSLFFCIDFSDYGLRYKRDYQDNNDIDALVNLLIHKNSDLLYLNICCEREFSPTLDFVLKSFLEKLGDKKLYLNIKNFAWNAGTPNVDTLIRLLKLANPDEIQKIRLNFIDIEDKSDKSIIQKCLETDQFKNASQVHIYNFSVDEFFEEFLKINHLKIPVEKLSEEMVLKLIEKVKARDPPIGSQFVISSQQLIEFDTLTPAFQNFDRVWRNLKEDQTPQKACLLTNEARCLVIIKWEKAIEATVCGFPDWNEDFQRCHGKNISVDLI